MGWFATQAAAYRSRDRGQKRRRISERVFPGSAGSPKMGILRFWGQKTSFSHRPKKVSPLKGGGSGSSSGFGFRFIIFFGGWVGFGLEFGFEFGFGFTLVCFFFGGWGFGFGFGSGAMGGGKGFRFQFGFGSVSPRVFTSVGRGRIRKAWVAMLAFQT